MPSPCKYAEERTVLYGTILVLSDWWCPFVNRKCDPRGCAFAMDPECRKEERYA